MFQRWRSLDLFTDDLLGGLFRTFRQVDEELEEFHRLKQLERRIARQKKISALRQEEQKLLLSDR